MSEQIVYVLATDEELRAEALRLSELRAQTYLTADRKARIGEQMAYVFFELNVRNGEVLDV